MTDNYPELKDIQKDFSFSIFLFSKNYKNYKLNDIEDWCISVFGENYSTLKKYDPETRWLRFISFIAFKYEDDYIAFKMKWD